MRYSGRVSELRILFVVHQFFPVWYTGTERFVLNLAQQYQRMGHSVTVLSYAITESDAFVEECGVLVKRYQFQNVPVIQVRHKQVPPGINFDIFYPEMEQMYEKIIDDNDIDVIHVGHPMRNGSMLRVARKRNIPVVLTLTDFWLMCPRIIAVTQSSQLCEGCNDGNKCIRDCFGSDSETLIKNRFRDVQDLIAIPRQIASPSHFLADLFRKNFRAHVRVIRHGIDYSGIHPHTRVVKKNDTLVFGYIGTVIPHKGVHIIVQALKRVDSRKIQIKIYGNHFREKEYFAGLLDLAKNDTRIAFLGEYQDEDMQEIMDGLDCSLCSSVWWENSPLTILKSLAYTVPVITTNVGGSAEFIKDKVNGFNFTIGDPVSLAGIFENILANPEQLNAIRKNIVRTRRVEEEAFEYEGIYQEILKAP